MSSQSRQKAPQVSAPQSAPAPGVAPAASSNEAAQGALATKQARTFTPLAELGTVVQACSDGARVTAHVASLWGELVGKSAARTCASPETPLASFEGTDLAPQVRTFATGTTLTAQPRFESDWTSAGGVGMSGQDAFFGGTPLAQGKVEITAVVADIKPVSRSMGSATTQVGGEVESSTSVGAEAGVEAGGLGVGTGAEHGRATRGTGASSVSSILPVSVFEGTLAFQCKVSVKRSFGPAETREGPVVAGTVVYQSVMGASEGSA